MVKLKKKKDVVAVQFGLNKAERKFCIKSKADKSMWELFCLQLPAIIYLLLFNYLPMVGIIVAFKQYKFSLGIFGSPWNGIDNFKFLFEAKTFYTLIRNTLGYNITFLILSHLLNMFLALCLYNVNKSKGAIKIFQTSMFLPYFLSWIVISYISYAFLSYNTGIINNLLEMVGLEKIEFYRETKYWPFIFLFFTLWKSAGFGTLVYYGSILSIDETQFEAAEIDGCSYVKKIWYIILPHLKVTIVTLVILNLGSILNSDFGMYYYLPNDSGVLYNVTDVLDTYITRSLKETTNFGAPSAASFIQSVCGFTLVILVNWVVKKINSESSLF